MRLRSLRSRLTIGILAVLVPVLLVGGAYVARDSDRAERQSLDDRIQRTAELLDQAALAVLNGELEETADERERLNRLLSATRSTLIVRFAGFNYYERGMPLKGIGNTPLGFSTRTAGGRRVRVYTKILGTDDTGGVQRLQSISALTQTEARQNALRRRLLLVGAAMLLLSGVGVAFASELVLRPLRRLRGHARGIEGEGDLATRVPVGGPREVRELAGSFNAMLGRLNRSADDRNQALDATRRFAADVGHELRTPLTSVQAALSTMQRHPDVPAETRSMMVADALDDNRRLVLLLDGLQALARGDAVRVERVDVDLASVVADAVAAIRDQHPGTTFDLRLPDDAVVVSGWEPGLRSVTDNLLRNAARHGRPDGRVIAELRPASPVQGAVLFVEDDGAGVAPEERDRIFRPFARAAGTEAPGSGLGLAIVAQQVGHHDATVAIEDGELGGARFVVRFPRAAG